MKRTKILSIILGFFIIFSTGCESTQTQTIEDSILKKSQEYVDNFKISKDESISIHRYDNRFCIYLNGDTKNPATLYIPCDFEEKIPFQTPKFSEKLDVPTECHVMFKNAKRYVLEYLYQSNFIKESDKEKVKKYVSEAKLYNRSYCGDEYSSAAMTTVGNTIYMNNDWINYLTEKLFVHELVHVISNATNSGQNNELSIYRSSMLNEALTEIITREISERYYLYQNPQIMISYDVYLEPTFDLIVPLNLIEAYYYSDKYDTIIKKIGKDNFDVIILTLNYLEQTPDLCYSLLYFEINEILKNKT